MALLLVNIKSILEYNSWLKLISSSYWIIIIIVVYLFNYLTTTIIIPQNCIRYVFVVDLSKFGLYNKQHAFSIAFQMIQQLR